MADLPELPLTNATIISGGWPATLDVALGEARRRDETLFLSTVNLQHLILAERGDPIADTLRRNDVWCTIDGAGARAYLRVFGGPMYPRLAGSDLLFALCTGAVTPPAKRIAVIGAAEESNRAVAESLQEHDVEVVGRFPNPQTVLFSDAFLSELDDLAPDLIMLFLGAGRQEEWFTRWSEHSTGPSVVIGLGGAADMWRKGKKAPALLARSGLEWAYRLWSEPRRLAHRYLVEYPIGGLRVLRRATALRSRVAFTPVHLADSAPDDVQGSSLRPSG